MVADLLSLERQVVRIHTDAMATDESGSKRMEVPFRSCGLENFLGINAHSLENQGQLVHERDVQVTLRVFDDLRSLRDTDAGCTMRTRGYDRSVEAIYKIGCGRGGARCHFFDRGEAMQLVARIDSLRAVAREEIHVEAQAGGLF